jgi:predicted DNA-binding transcriptional regulator YafY
MVKKEDCRTVDEVAERFEVSRATLYHYLNFLRIQRHKFPFDRRSYITNEDAEAVRVFIEQNNKDKR